MTRWLLTLCFAPLLTFAQTGDIPKLLHESEVAWNRGDLPVFASYYEDSPETTFIGKDVTRGGVSAILDRYKRGYPNRDSMGQLTFSEITVRPLTDDLAISTGKYSLKRTAAGGGDATGRFTLVWRRTKSGWKIIHDHSS